jgi:hypothetical protein
MSSSRLFSQTSPKKEEPASLSLDRKIFMDGLTDKINNHIMGTHILEKVEVGSMCAYFNDFSDLEREYIRNRLSPYLPNWKVDSVFNLVDKNARRITADFWFGFLRISGGVVIGTVEAALLLCLTDNVVASLFCGTVTSLAFLCKELDREEEHRSRNDRMYDFIDPLESCDLKLPVAKGFRESIRQIGIDCAKEKMLQQETQKHMRPRFA